MAPTLLPILEATSAPNPARLAGTVPFLIPVLRLSARLPSPAIDLLKSGTLVAPLSFETKSEKDF